MKINIKLRFIWWCISSSANHLIALDTINCYNRLIMPERGENRPKPILCRNLSPESSRAIDMLVGIRVYRSRDEALAKLATEGLRLKLTASPTLRELIRLNPDNL